jgi:hypothetical protein
MIDFVFESMAQQNTDPALSAEEMIEECWRMMKRGILRLEDDGDDQLIPEAVTPSQRARARVEGAKLSVRQHLRRAARRQDAREPGVPG